MVAAHVNGGALNGINPDDMGYPKASGVEAVRLGAYALVRLGSYDGLAGALLDREGRPRSRWWPVAFAFQRVNDPRAAAVLLDLFNGEGQLTRAFAARGLGGVEGSARRGAAARGGRGRRRSRSRCGFRPCAAIAAARRRARRRGDAPPDHLAARSIRTCSSRRSPRWRSCAIRARSSC